MVKKEWTIQNIKGECFIGACTVPTCTIVKSTMNNEHWTLYNKQCTMYIVQKAMNIGQCPV